MNAQRRRWMTMGRISPTLTLLLIGCAFMTGVEPPQVGLTAIRMVTFKGLEATFQVDLRVLNPNHRPLPVQGVVCDLTLNGHHLARGVAHLQKEISAYGNEIIPVMVYASMLDMLDVAQGLIADSQSDRTDAKWTYRAQGHLSLSGVAWPVKLPFDLHGDIDVQALTAAKPSDK